MLNKPKFLTPSTNMQKCVIDATSKHLPFSCIIDGNEAVTAWQIKIYRLRDNLLVYETEKIDWSEKPFYPVDEKNRNVVFSVDLKEYSTLNNNLTTDENSEYITLTNSDKPYYWTIQVWGTSGVTSTSCEEVFYANATPTIEIKYSQDNESFSDLTNETVLNSRTAYFKAIYSDPDPENPSVSPLKRYGWRLTDKDTGQVLLDTISHNQIYGTADNIICSYNGFLNDGNYSIELYIETQNGTIIFTDKKYFSNSYQTTFLTNDFVSENLRDEAAIRNSWKEAKAIEGKSSVELSSNDYILNFPIVDGTTSAIAIKRGENITYDYGTTSNLDIAEESYIVLSMQLLNNQDTDLFFAEGTDSYGNSAIRKLSFESGQFKYMISTSSENIITEYYKPQYTPNFYVWYVIIMAPYSTNTTLLKVFKNKAINGRYPSSDLYPSDSLFPSFGEWKTSSSEEVKTE